MKYNNEIQSAVEYVRSGNNYPVVIRELPVLPEFEYVYTCGFCGCHNTPTRVMTEAGKIMICSWCGHLAR